MKTTLDPKVIVKPRQRKSVEPSWSIDSLKVRIPLSKVRVIDESIREIVARVSLSSGEVLESKENTKASRDDKGIKTTFSIEQRATKFDTIPYLIILINAKQLKCLYFEGIRISNVSLLHSYLMSLEVVYFSLNELLKSECTDIDFKKDFKAKELDIKKAFDTMQSHATPSKDYDKGSKLFWQKGNKGLQFNKRNSTKFDTAPFLKIYSKTLDLKGKSNIFALNYLSIIHEDLWRIEYTIKNKKHLSRFDIGNTFSDLLSLSQEQMEGMCDKSLKAVLEQRTRDVNEFESEIPARHIVLVNSLIWHLDNGNQWSIIKSNLLGSLKGTNRSKKNTQLDELYKAYIRPIEGYNKHLAIDSILNQIGYTF